jgi:hypothetical protein
VKSGKLSATTVFYGYTKDAKEPGKWAIDEEAAAVVRRIFGMALRGSRQTQIAKLLNDENVPTPRERQSGSRTRCAGKQRDKSLWYPTMITKILRDERYTGKQIYGKTRVVEVGGHEKEAMPESEWVIMSDAIPAIVTEEQFKAVSDKINKRRSGFSNTRSSVPMLFSGKMKCGHCGYMMRVSKKKQEIRYKCNTPLWHTGFNCNGGFVSEQEVAVAVLDAFRQQVMLAGEAQKTLDTRAKQSKSSIEKLQTEVIRLQRTLDKSKTNKIALWERFHNGEMSAESFHRENEKADEQVLRCSAKIPELKAKICELEVETGCENAFVVRFGAQSGIQELTRVVVEEFISEVRVYSADRIEVVFSYADEYEKLAALIGKVKGKRG